MANAVNEIMDLSLRAFRDNDLEAAAHVEPLEQVIDSLKDQLRARHIERLQQGACTIEAGFIWSDILTDLERAADHCSNIAASVIDVAQHNMNLHESLRAVRSGNDSEFEQQFRAYSERFSLAK
jgi:phosphate:Na+ symporter